MDTVLRIAVLVPPEDPMRLDAAHRLRRAVDARVFGVSVLREADPAYDGGFDAVLTMTAVQPKLSACPSIALFDRGDLAGLPGAEAMTRVLSHDAYLIASPEDRTFLEDAFFGARKRGSPIEPWLRCPAADTPPAAERSDELLVAFALPPGAGQAGLLRTLANRRAVRVVAFEPLADATAAALGLPVEPVAPDGRALAALARTHADALCLVPSSPSGRLPVALMRAALAEAGCRVFDDAEDAPADILLRRIAAAPPPPNPAPLDCGAATRSLRALYDATLVAKGYRPDPAAGTGQPPVAYVVRAGGRPARYLERALSSLAAQSYPALRAVVVLWRDAPDLDEVLARPWPFPVTVVRAPGAMVDRSLVTGLRAVKAGDAAWFGILDDDDALHPNHVRSLLATLAHRRRLSLPPAEVAYSGSVEAVEDEGAAPVQRQRLPLPVPSRRARPGMFFMPNPARFWSPAIDLPPHAHLAATRLIDEELLTACGLPVGEDTHLLNLLAERSAFAFSCEVTVTYHFHTSGQSGWWRRPDMDTVVQRLALRVLGRIPAVPAAYGGGAFPAPDHPLGTAIPDSLFNATDMALPTANPPPPTDAPASAVAGGIANGSSVPLPRGVHRAVWFFEGLVPDGVPHLHLATDGPVRDVGTPTVAPVRDGWTVAHHLLALADARLEPGELRLVWPDGAQPAALGLRVRPVPDGVPVPWPRFADTSGRVWIFGAGSAGRAALRHLSRIGLSGRVAGFIDSRPGAPVEGYPVLPPGRLSEPDTQADTVLIASQHWREIRRQLEDAGRRGVYSSHPVNPECLWFLP